MKQSKRAQTKRMIPLDDFGDSRKRLRQSRVNTARWLNSQDSDSAESSSETSQNNKTDSVATN